MTHSSNRVAIHISEIVVGKPLPHSIYDEFGTIILKRGAIPESVVQLAHWADQKLFRDADETSHRKSATREHPQLPLEMSRPAKNPDHALSLDQIKLSIGDVFQVQMPLDQTEHRAYVKLIGYMRGKSVIVTVPEGDGHPYLVRDGQAFVVRFFSGKNAYAFTTTALKTAFVPFPHLHLGYPSQVRGMSIRTSERVAVRLICSVENQNTNNGGAVAALMTNISMGGAFLVSKAPIGAQNTDVSIKFRLQLGDIESFLTIDSSICSISRGDAGSPDGEYQQGVKFNHLSDNEAITLTAFIYQKLALNSAN